MSSVITKFPLEKTGTLLVITPESKDFYGTMELVRGALLVAAKQPITKILNQVKNN